MSTRLPLTEGLKSLHYYFAILDDLVFSTDLIEIDARSFFAEGDRIIISIDNSCKYILPDQISRCLAAGMDDHIGKPINPGNLLRAISKWSQGREVTSEDALATG